MFDEGEREGGKKEKSKKRKGDKKGQQREDREKVALLYFLKGVLLSTDTK